MCTTYDIRFMCGPLYSNCYGHCKNFIASRKVVGTFKQLYTKLDIITVELKPSLLLNVSLRVHLIIVLLVLLSSLNLCFDAIQCQLYQFTTSSVTNPSTLLTASVI